MTDYKLITLRLQVVVSSEECDCVHPESIADYLNWKLKNDPGFFSDFGPEDIVRVEGISSTKIY